MASPRDTPSASGGNDNYGDERIGYKGSALSQAAALQGDRSALNTGAASPAVGSSGFSGGFAGGAAPPSAGGVVGGSIGGAGLAPPKESAPYPTSSVQDAGVAPLDARVEPPAIDAQVVAIDAQVVAIDAGSGVSVDAALWQPDAGDAGGPNDAAYLGLDTGTVDGATAPDAAPSDATAATRDGATPQAKDSGTQAAPDAAASAALIPENPFQRTDDQAASTFAIDVDTGSYTLSRGSINAGRLPDPKSVRVEEFLNYFHFHYAQPEGEEPLSLYTELGACPWNAERQLLLVGIQGQEVELKDQPPANLVFLIDVSGSMAAAERLPLLKKGFRMLTSQLREQDRVSIVTYAGRESVVLTAVPGSHKQEIVNAINRLESSGSTNGQGGIQKAYEIAQQNFMKGGNNRVILATDGDFNVGLSQTPALVDFISEKRKTGVYLSVYGFGAAWNGGNYKDEVGEQLADHGDGIYFYIDSQEEARRAFLESVSGSLLTVAKDVKVQVEMNPLLVKAYRLIGYENRVLTNAAFSNDAVDGGELGAGLSVTALFEIIPAGAASDVPAPRPGSVPPLAGADAGAGGAEEFEPVQGQNLFEVRLRYKQGLESRSKLVRAHYTHAIKRDSASPKFQFAASVSELALQLRHSQYLGVLRGQALLDQIAQTRPLDSEGAIEELLQLAQRARELGLGR